MGNEADKKFTWVIKNFSSLGFKSVSSDVFVAGRCKWRLCAFQWEVDNCSSSLYLYLAVPNHESLPSGWRPHAKISVTIVNQIPGGVSQLREAQYWFDQRNIDWVFPSMILLSDLYARDSGFLVNDELKIVAKVDVLEVVGELDVPVVTTDFVDINGFQVLASQIESVNSLFKDHPNIASNVRAKNPHLRTTYLNVLLGLTTILCKSSGELSNSDLEEAYSAVRFVTKAGFNLDWLEEALKEAFQIQIQEIEEKLNELTEKRAHMNTLLKTLE
ncbi:Meprin and TRAF (MATH) homology domain-containing protein [Raphanus sativus]|uniref:MATH domain and coiled-coil domain-containing protein At3g27040-like n=1 Tax=Raphanus sativus TaxID=3726 RepID=A0A6J0KLG5_RAPSA|nr:MATH domain and coiled-coil domain-containing protein At3g27040-like [Raphanus sativus]KAJ4880630.1 Meprin and TRAF (MATH) homology domain-containing protein [Raphanus sativus]